MEFGEQGCTVVEHLPPTGPAQQVFEWGGGGGELERQTSRDKTVGKDESTRGVRGYAPPKNFDFNSSQMPRNTFKINQRNPTKYKLSGRCVTPARAAAKEPLGGIKLIAVR